MHFLHKHFRGHAYGDASGMMVAVVVSLSEVHALV